MVKGRDAPVTGFTETLRLASDEAGGIVHEWSWERHTGARDALDAPGWMGSRIRPARASTGEFEGMVKGRGKVGRRGHPG